MMKRPLALLLCLALCLTGLISGNAFAQDGPIVCHPGDDIEVVLSRTEGSEMSAGIAGSMSYDKEIFSVISGDGLVGGDGIFINAERSVKISFHVNQYAPAGTYTIDVTVLEACDAGGRKFENVRISPVQVIVEDAAVPEEAASAMENAVRIPVYYVDENNRTVALEEVWLTYSDYIFVNPLKLPDGYVFASDISQYVTVENGKASVSMVVFRVARSEDTAAVAASSSVTVPVYYVDTQSNQILARDEVQLTVSGWIYLDTSRIPDSYTIAGDSHKYVTVANGAASPASIVFRLEQKEAPAQAPTVAPRFTVEVPVLYVCGDRVIAEGTCVCGAGMTTTIVADEQVYGSDYVLGGSSSVNVTVSSQGIASPSTVTFYLVRSATAAPEASSLYSVQVPVQYVCDGRIVIAGTWECLAGETTTIYAREELYGSSFMLSGSASVNVYVSSQGIASPSTVTFYLVRKTTAAP